MAGFALAWCVAANTALAAPRPAFQELAGSTVLADRMQVQGGGELPAATATDDPNLAAAGDAGAAKTVSTILFASGSAHLTPSATRVLDGVGRAMAAPDMAADRFRVEGHADTAGAPDANRDLAARRAQAVAAYLRQNCGVEAARLDVEASGRALRRSTAHRVSLINQGP